MNTPLEPMTSVKGYLVFESFVSAPVFRYVELTSQGRPWAVQHLGDIRIFWKKGAKGFGIAHGEAENPPLNVTS